MKSLYAIQLSTTALAILDLFGVNEDGSCTISRINVPYTFRGKGYGSALLKQCCTDADNEGVHLELCVSGSGGLSDQQLTRWYKRYGFVGNILMKRTPRSLRATEEIELSSCYHHDYDDSDDMQYSNYA